MTAALSPTIERVLRGQLCSGCGLCAGVSNGAIEMRMAAPGFARPRQLAPLDDQAEAVVAGSCPGAVVQPWTEAEGSTVHPYWGPLRGLYVGHSNDPVIRFAGSSGGGVSAMAAFALRTGLIDRVVQVAADPAQPTGNIVVVSTSVEEIVACAGSRYAPSSPLAGIEAVLADGGKAAFIGKPCDASALRGLARYDERVARHIPLVMSFFCAGTPSEHGADLVLQAMGVPREELAAFRYRGEGWPGRAKATLKSGAVRDMSYDDSWGGYLADEVQFRCKICPDAVGGVADVVCADAWYGDERGYPRFDEQDGRSLFAVRTKAGEQLLAQATAAGAISLTPLDAAEIERMQPGQALRRRMIRARTAALAVTLRPRPHMRGLYLNEAARKGRFRESARNFLGTLRRLVMRRL